MERFGTPITCLSDLKVGMMVAFNDRRKAKDRAWRAEVISARRGREPQFMIIECHKNERNRDYRPGYVWKVPMNFIEDGSYVPVYEVKPKGEVEPTDLIPASKYMDQLGL